MSIIGKRSGRRVSRNLTRFSRRAEVAGRESIEENIISRRAHLKDAKLFIIEWACLVVALIFLAITQALWYENSYSVSGYVAGGTFTEATLGKVSSLNPLFASTNSEKTIARLLFSSLTEVDYSGHTGLGLAESVRSSEDGKAYTVKLRSNIYWSDGEPITIEDVLYTTAILQDVSITSPYSANLSRVKVSTDDSGNIVFSLPSAYADFSSALAFPILPKHILGDISPSQLASSDFSKNPVSSGAFKFNASQSIGTTGESVIYLAKNPYYFRSAPLLDSFAVHAYLDKESIISAINSGTVTATAELTSADASSITTDKFYIRESSLNSAAFAFFNCNSGIFRDVNIRSAVREGINIEQIREAAGVVREVDYPILDTQVDSITYPNLPAYNKAHAEGILSGKSGTPISLVTVKKGSLPSIAEAFAGELRDLGFEVNVSIMDSGQDFIRNIIRPRSYDILIYDVDLGPDPDILAYYHSSQAVESGYNLSNYKNTYADDSILASRTSTDDSYRRMKYETFLSYWVDDVPAIGLYQSTLTYYYNKNVRIYSEDVSLVTAYDRFSSIEYWSSTKSSLNRTP